MTKAFAILHYLILFSQYSFLEMGNFIATMITIQREALCWMTSCTWRHVHDVLAICIISNRSELLKNDSRYTKAEKSALLVWLSLFTWGYYSTTLDDTLVWLNYEHFAVEKLPEFRIKHACIDAVEKDTDCSGSIVCAFKENGSTTFWSLFIIH